MRREDLFENISVSEKEIFFISDIEHFSLEIKDYLINEIRSKEYKLIVFIGDILSGFSTENSSYKIFQQSHEVFEMFYDVKKIMNDHKKEKIEKWDLAKVYIGDEVSKRLSKKYSKEIKSFKAFVTDCFKLKIPVLLFSGNHDSLFSWSNLSNERYIPILEKIHNINGLKIPYDLEKIKIGRNLFLMGIHVNEDIIGEYNFYQIKEYLEKLGRNIEDPEKIIFVSHLPGKSKFSKLGSRDIQNFKRRFKFKSHYHGHCKNYNGEYLEEGVPTRSVHFNWKEEIKCKRCGKVVEWKPGVPVNKNLLDEFELEEPKYNYCFECRKKWSEENLKGKECGKEISMHEYLWHNGYCESHGDLAQENWDEEDPEFESKIRNLKEENLPKEIKDSPYFEEEYVERGYACILDKKGFPLEDEDGMFLFRKLEVLGQSIKT